MIGNRFTKCEDCTYCKGCGRKWCRAEEVSPGEQDGICRECWATEDGAA